MALPNHIADAKLGSLKRAWRDQRRLKAPRVFFEQAGLVFRLSTMGGRDIPEQPMALIRAPLSYPETEHPKPQDASPGTESWRVIGVRPADDRASSYDPCR